MEPGSLFTSLGRLSDAELLARVQQLAARERGATALLVAHLAELDTRDVHLRAGHGSLFAYCREVLGLAEQEAYSRIAVARVARRYPLVLELLESGSLHLTAVRLLGPHLTAANHRELLQRARGKTKLQLEEMAAALWPRPDAPSFVRKLPTRPLPQPAAPPAARVSSAGPSASAALAAPAAAPGGGGAAHPSLPPPPARRSTEVTPLAPDRYKVQVTIGSETLEKLRLAQGLLRHAVPSGDEAVILDRALTALLAQLAQRRLAAAASPRPSPGVSPGSRRVPSDVRRAVWVRDQGRCAFVGTSGRRCSECTFLEFHHVFPYALGGEATTSNIQLRCRSHNAYEARLYFGAGRVRPDAGAARGTAESGEPSSSVGSVRR